MSPILIAALIIVGFFGFCAIMAMVALFSEPPTLKKQDFQSRCDEHLLKSLRVAPYICLVATATTAILSFWVSPQIGFLAVAGFSAVGVFICNWFYWRTYSPTTGLLTALAWYVPYRVARRLFFLPNPALLHFLQYISVTVAVIFALKWFFRSKLERMIRRP